MPEKSKNGFQVYRSKCMIVLQVAMVCWVICLLFHYYESTGFFSLIEGIVKKAP